MIHVCIQIEQRSAATRRAQEVKWHQSDTSGSGMKMKRVEKEKKEEDEIHRGWKWEVCVGWGGGCTMEMSALLKSEDSTFLPSGSHSVKSTGTEQSLCQPVNRPTMKAIYITCPAHTTLAQKQGGMAESQH